MCSSDLFSIFVLVLLLVLPFAAAKLAADVFILVLLAVMLGEGYLVAAKVRRLAQERYPSASTRGVTAYVIMRGISIRRMRLPKPRVNRGDKV